MRGALMVCGTASDVGKSLFVAGLCRALSRRGVRVAPFKSQNMALNSYVTLSGHEIGRAQAAQAFAAGVEPEVGMNPVLLKPTGVRMSQVVVNGRPVAHESAADYQRRKPELLGIVVDAFAELRSRFDVVIAEGAGSPAEINLLDHDIVNLRLAHRLDIPAVIVGDIDRGGVFAALYGTVALLPDHYRALVGGFVINKFRGDPTLLGDGLNQLEERCGVPALGVLPYLSDVALDAEDSLALEGRRPRTTEPALGDTLDVAVVRFPHISNFTDLDALAIEPGVGVRFVTGPGDFGSPDLVILPGTKATVADLAWLRSTGLERAVLSVREQGAQLVGICGGYQMLGQRIVDAVESRAGEVAGLGVLDAVTTFVPEKTTRRRRGRALGRPVDGYEIHHGQVDAPHGGWVTLEDEHGRSVEGATAPGVYGTSLHGLFEQDEFRAGFLATVAAARGKRFVAAGVRFAEARAKQYDRVADALEEHLDMATLEQLIAKGAP